jgi:hypothetical protein
MPAAARDRGRAVQLESWRNDVEAHPIAKSNPVAELVARALAGMNSIKGEPYEQTKRC